MPRVTQERPIARVPVPIIGILAVAFAAQIALRAADPPHAPAPEDLPSPPSAATLRFASFGDPVPLGKALMLYLQSFDLQAANQIPFQRLDYARVELWLARILDLDPSGQYPLMAAARLYAEVPDRSKQYQMLEFVYREFLKDPERRWPWLAHAAVIAKHKRRDLALARRYAAAIQAHAKGDKVPLWARQMEIFILEDMDELETARIMIGGLLESGRIHDPVEIRFLDQRLKEIESRMPKVQKRR